MLIATNCSQFMSLDTPDLYLANLLVLQRTIVKAVGHGVYMYNQLKNNYGTGQVDYSVQWRDLAVQTAKKDTIEGLYTHYLVGFAFTTVDSLDTKWLEMQDPSGSGFEFAQKFVDQYVGYYHQLYSQEI